MIGMIIFLSIMDSKRMLLQRGPLFMTYPIKYVEVYPVRNVEPKRDPFWLKTQEYDCSVGCETKWLEAPQ